MKKSLYKIDKKFEEQSTAYILGSGVLEDNGIEDIETVSDKDEQKKGKDLKGVYKGDRISIDIKSIGAIIPTFCQEMMNVTSGKVGWLVNPDIETDYYLYAYHLTDEGGNNYYTGKRLIADSTDCIIRNVYIMVSRQKLIQTIEKNIGITLDVHAPQKILDDIASLLEKPIEECSGQFVYDDDRLVKKKDSHNHHDMWISLSSSGRIHEQPLNIIVSRETLARISEFAIDEDVAHRIQKKIIKTDVKNDDKINDGKNDKSIKKPILKLNTASTKQKTQQ